MKNILYLICSTALVILVIACNDENQNPLPPCDPDVISKETQFYFNQTGTLTLFDTTPHHAVPLPVYHINAEEISHTPLVPCNLPVSDFNIEIGDTINILFSGNLMLLPPTVGTFDLQFELLKIKQINTND